MLIKDEKHYRNKLIEYLYDSKSIYLRELPINKCRIDFVKIYNNYDMTAYEIKSDLDNLKRLENQIKDYQKIFNKIYVFCSEKHIEKVKKVVDENVGIIILNLENDKIKCVKKAKQNNDYLDKKVMFKILRKYEYEKIIKNCGLELPKVSDFKYYTECEKIFCNLDVKKAYLELKKQLKNRYKTYEKFNEINFENYFNYYFKNYENEKIYSR